MSIRSERIAEQIRAELDQLLRQETSDPRVGLLTLTRVKLSADMGTATIFWSPLAADPETDVKDISDGLPSATGFLRGRLARRLSLRGMPTLSFRYDPSLREGSETLALLRGLPEVQSESQEERADDEVGTGEGEHGEE